MRGVILTGGRPTSRNGWNNRRVVQYDINGFVADLPDLITGRMDHACSFYYGYASVEGVSRNRHVSLLIMQDPHMHNYSFLDLCCNWGN